MDLDAFVMAHHHEWERLRVLSERRRLSGDEVDELLDLYQRTATHLSIVRSGAPDPSVVQYLSTLLARTRQRTSGVRTVGWADLGRFFTESFPAALYRARRWWLSVAALNVLVALVIGVWVVRNPGVQTGFIPPEQVDQLVNHEFEGYYSEYAAHDFAARVWTNNAWVTAQCIVLGVLGVPVIYVLWQNVLNLGVMGGLLAAHDKTSLFFGLILPHGLLELTAVFVAGGVGLRIFWSWVDPGPRTRMAALAAEARAGVGIALGLVVVLFVTGVIEGFVTPSGLPTWVRVGIGVIAEIAFFAYVFTLGRWAAQRGETGDLGERDLGDSLPVAV
ncbi:stage II sporulation protein M [Luteipulveratus halotolerans]|uniref:Membrane protein n=1 Tax=Luteipulveratus halotolerans TaxID=1631356 RepID=A0A0L6CNX2_9MICO|nr:stage II sporulation protein M [Luteipulveratus halotolerans]KNX39444.1 membrane protein [Luteipulveratus halotolerans]